MPLPVALAEEPGVVVFVDVHDADASNSVVLSHQLEALLSERFAIAPCGALFGEQARVKDVLHSSGVPEDSLDGVDSHDPASLLLLVHGASCLPDVAVGGPYHFVFAGVGRDGTSEPREAWFSLLTLVVTGHVDDRIAEIEDYRHSSFTAPALDGYRVSSMELLSVAMESALSGAPAPPVVVVETSGRPRVGEDILVSALGSWQAQGRPLATRVSVTPFGDTDPEPLQQLSPRTFTFHAERADTFTIVVDASVRDDPSLSSKHVSHVKILPKAQLELEPRYTFLPSAGHRTDGWFEGANAHDYAASVFFPLEYWFPRTKAPSAIVVGFAPSAGASYSQDPETATERPLDPSLGATFSARYLSGFLVAPGLHAGIGRWLRFREGDYRGGYTWLDLGVTALVGAAPARYWSPRDDVGTLSRRRHRVTSDFYLPLGVSWIHAWGDTSDASRADFLALRIGLGYVAEGGW